MGLLTLSAGNPLVREQTLWGALPHVPTPLPPHWHASGTHRWNQSPLLRAELHRGELGASISPVLGMES